MNIIFTSHQYQQLIENGKEENRDKDHPPVAKLSILGTGCIWLLSELEPEYPHIAFGLCDLGLGFPELGYVDIHEIVETAGELTRILFNDAKFEGKYPMSVYAQASRLNDAITVDDVVLQKCAEKPQP